MDSSDATWAPQSPDLASYHLHDAEPTHPQHHGYRGSISHSAPYSPPASSPTLHTKPASMPRPAVKKEETAMDPDYFPDASEQPRLGDTAMAGTDHIEVKTKFPVARIKRIMQADDDVGKVAQVTPHAVSKALELFMISLVTKAAAEAKARSSKRVAAAHLKQAVKNDKQFDFLLEIVDKVPDAPQAAEKHEGDAMEADGKKKRASAGRKKKKVEDDDF